MNPDSNIREQSSMTYWFPKLRDLVGNVPETVKIGTEEREIDDGAPATDGTTTIQFPNVAEFAGAVSALDAPPAFLRSDQMSAKHRMAEGSKVVSVVPEEFESHLWQLWERNRMAWGVPKPECYYAREWLDLYHEYSAFTGTPIAAELRFFIYENEVYSHGFYWPKDAIRQPSHEDWKTRHESVKEMAHRHSEGARELAEQVASAFDGYWSVDFALTDDREWFCIDMARGEASWHPEACTPPDGVER